MILILDKSTSRSFRGKTLAEALNEISAFSVSRRRGAESSDDYWLVTFTPRGGTEEYRLQYPQDVYNLADVVNTAAVTIVRDLVHSRQTHEVYTTETRL